MMRVSIERERLKIAEKNFAIQPDLRSSFRFENSMAGWTRLFCCIVAVLVLAMLPTATPAQSVHVNKEVLRRGDTLVVSTSGFEGVSGLGCSLIFIDIGKSTGCGGEYLIDDSFIHPDRSVTRIAAILYDMERYGGRGTPPANSNTVIDAKFMYIFNDRPDGSDAAIRMSKQHLRSGETFTVEATPPDPDTAVTLMLYRPPGRTPEGLAVMPELARFEENGLSISATAPLTPGNYEIWLFSRANNYQPGILFARHPFTVELALPRVAFDLEERYEIERGEAIEISPRMDMRKAAFTAANTSQTPYVLLKLERQTGTGEWKDHASQITGYAISIDEFREDRLGQYRHEFWQSGTYRVSAYYGRFLIGSEDFEVEARSSYFSLTDRQFSEPASWNNAHVYQRGEEITVSYPRLDLDPADRVEIELYPHDPLNGDVSQYQSQDREYRPDTELIRTWTLRGPGDVVLPSDLAPGHYEFLARKIRKTDTGDFFSEASFEVLTITPPQERFSITMNTGEAVSAWQRFPVDVAYPEMPDRSEYGLWLQIFHVAGTYSNGLVIPERLVWEGRVSDGDTEITVGGEDSRGNDIFQRRMKSGQYEARLSYGRNYYDSDQNAVLATQRFDVTHRPLPGAVSLLTPSPDNRTETKFSVTVPEGFEIAPESDSYELWFAIKGEVLPFGLKRPFRVIEKIRLHQGLVTADGVAEVDREFEAGSYQALLVQDAICLLAPCPEILIDRLDFEVAHVHWTGPFAYAWSDDVLADLSKGPLHTDFEPADAAGEEPDNPGNYQPPPYLAFDIANFPSELQPGTPMTIGMRFENNGGMTAAGVMVDIALADPQSEEAPDDLKADEDYCSDTGGGLFRCRFGDMAPGDIADVTFHAETPMSGGVIWTVEMFSTGDLGGIRTRSGMLGQRAPPHVVEVVVIADQTRVEDHVPSYRYPFAASGSGRQSRYLLVVGYNLPQSPADEILLADNDTVNYGFLAYPDSENAFHQDWIGKGWQRFYDIEDEHAARARAKQDGYDAILVRADLLQGILPGLQSVALVDRRGKEVRGHWSLEFGDLSAQLSFVRLREDGGFDLLSEAYLPERIHLAVETNVRLPVAEIPVLIDTENLNGTPITLKMVARQSSIAGGRIYLTGPLDLHHQSRPASLTGGTSVPVVPDTDSLPVILAQIDTNFIFRSFRLPVDPFTASASVKISPGEGDHSWLWKDALTRAAKCHDDINVTNWNSLTVSESKEIWNLLVFDNSDHFPGQSVSFGHHAAAILLRDLFVVEMRQQQKSLQWLRTNQRGLRAMIAALKPIVWRDEVALLRMQVTDIDGAEIPYSYVVSNDADWLADTNGTSENAILQWQQDQSVAAIDAMLEAMEQTLDQAVDAGDCDVEDLIRLTGFNFLAVGERLKARLMVLAEVVQSGGQRRLLWRPDNSARFWVNQVAPLAAAVRAQQRASQTDTSMVLAVTAAITAPAGIFGSQGLQFIVLLFEVMDFGYSLYDAYSQIAASNAEIEFSSGASVVIGEERYEEAMANAQTWIGQGLGVGVSAFGVFSSAYDVLPRLVFLRRVARGRHLAQSLLTASSLQRLTPADLQDFTAFATHSYSKSLIKGADTLTDLEKRVIGLVDEVSQARPTHMDAMDASFDTVLDSAATDGFTASTPVRFSPDGTGSGHATVQPPVNGRIESPQVSGDVPNALEARVPEGAQAVFTRSGTGEEITAPLGRKLGEGSTSEVFDSKDHPGARAIRITYVNKDSPASIVDRFGDDVLRNIVPSDHIRPVKIFADFPDAEGTFGGRRISRVSEVEQLEGTAKRRIESQGGKLTIAQLMAMDGALTDLNTRGFVWLDNKSNNFDFVPLGDGSGRVQIVVMDPGGIYKIRPGAGAAFGLTDAQLARRIQLRVNGDFTSQVPDFSHIKTPMYRSALRRETLLEDYRDTFDFEGMGLSGPDDIQFNPMSGEDFGDLTPIFESVD